MRKSVAGVALLLAACQTPHSFTTPDASWRTHTGQLKFTSGERVLIGEVVVSQRGAEDFQLEFQKGGGIALLKLRLDATTARAEGLLARGSWQGPPEKAPAALRGWMELRKAFAQAPASRVTFAPRDSQDRFEFVFTR